MRKPPLEVSVSSPNPSFHFLILRLSRILTKFHFHDDFFESWLGAGDRYNQSRDDLSLAVCHRRRFSWSSHFGSPVFFILLYHRFAGIYRKNLIGSPTAFSISFNFFNHAKIIGTENIVYIGSANFSNESKQNIETGVIIEDSAFIARLYDEFFEYIKGNSTPYFDDDFNLLRLLTLNLIAKFTVHRAKLSDTLFQRTAYGTYYLPDSPDNVYFSGEDLAELVFDLQSFQDLDVRAENTYSEDNNGYNDDIDEIVARLSEIDVNWLIEIASDDGVLFDFVNFNYEQTWNNCLQEYIAEAYDEYLDEYVERAQNDAIAIYDSKKQDFEDVSDIFIRGIDSIIEVLKLVEELIDRYKDARISADIDNT